MCDGEMPYLFGTGGSNVTVRMGGKWRICTIAALAERGGPSACGCLPIDKHA